MKYHKRRLYTMHGNYIHTCEHCGAGSRVSLCGRLYFGNSYYSSYLIFPNTIIHNAVRSLEEFKLQTFKNYKDVYHVRMCWCCKALQACVKTGSLREALIVNVIRRI